MSRKPGVYFLIAYDIRCPRRLRKVHREIKSQGMAIQYSVFLCDPMVFASLWKGLQALIEPEDDLRAYPVASLNDLWLTGRGWSQNSPDEKGWFSKVWLHWFG